MAGSNHVNLLNISAGVPWNLIVDGKKILRGAIWVVAVRGEMNKMGSSFRWNDVQWGIALL